MKLPMPVRLGDLPIMTLDLARIKKSAKLREARLLTEIVNRLRQKCEEARFCFSAAEAALAAVATLLLHGVGACVTLILVGSASAGKTTIARMFFGHRMVVRKDRFTPASFVSHKADENIATLKKKHMLPLVKDRVLVTKELAQMFRGRESDLTATFATLANILDGLGDTSHSGTHGGIDYSEPHRFTWIGCSTPFEREVWRVMAQLGSKMLFFRVDGGGTSIDDLVDMDEVKYEQNVRACTRLVNQTLDILFPDGVALRALNVTVPNDLRRRVAYLAKCLSVGRMIGTEGPEDPKRVLTLLLHLAKGRALVYGRQEVCDEDLTLLEHIVVSSMPGRRGTFLYALRAASTDGLTVAKAQLVLQCTENTARAALRELVQLGLAEEVEVASGKPGQPAACFRLRAGGL